MIQSTFYFSNLLKGIDYYTENTAELVKESKLVLLHASSPLSYSILFKKPTLFLTSNDLNKSWIGTRIKSFANEVNSKVININSDIDKNLNLDKLFKIDAFKYQKYKNIEFIPENQSKSPTRKLSEI